MPDKNLFILVDPIDLKDEDLSMAPGCDRLAMTPAAMAAFEENGLSYMTMYDFYDNKTYRADNTELIYATEEFFSRLDRKCEDLLGYPRSFTGNINYFAVLFAEMLYVTGVCSKIKGFYNKVYLASSMNPHEPIEAHPSFSPMRLLFTEMSVGLRNKVRMLNKVLAPEWIRINADNSSCINKNRFIGLSRRVPKKILEELRAFLAKCTLKRKEVVFVVQDDYEVSLLKNHMPEILFMDPVKRSLWKLIEDEDIKSRLARLINDEIAGFIKRWLLSFESELLELFNQYRDNILSRVKALFSLLEDVFDRHNPIALVYAVGANTIYDDICAHVANKKTIPIFYFQHAGTRVFFKDIYQKFLEHNNNIKRINILQARVEEKMLAEHATVETRTLGSIKAYNLFLEHKSIDLSSNRKAVYCNGSHNFGLYKNIMSHMSDKDLHCISKDIIDVVSKYNVEMDIKVDLFDERYLQLYFNKLLNGRRHGNINIIKGVKVEPILKRYGLVIMDYIVSAMPPFLLVLDMPIIIYLKDCSIIRDETIADVKKRFYIVENKEELDECIKLYSLGKLKSKFSLDIMDKYAFPVGAGDPRVNISDYIRKRTTGSKVHKNS